MYGMYSQYICDYCQKQIIIHRSKTGDILVFFSNWMLSSYLNLVNLKFTYHLCYICYMIIKETKEICKPCLLEWAVSGCCSQNIGQWQSPGCQCWQTPSGFMLFSRNKVWNSEQVFRSISDWFLTNSAIFNNSVASVGLLPIAGLQADEAAGAAGKVSNGLAKLLISLRNSLKRGTLGKFTTGNRFLKLSRTKSP